MLISETRPKVSIYISTYNRLGKLKRAINSVLGQDYQNWELLVCDDASTDGTSEFMNALILTDERIRYLRSESNKGACQTRNLGIFNATGLFITGLDDDDEFTPDRLTFFLQHWDDKYSFICCDFLNKYPNGESKQYYCQDKEYHVFDAKDLLYENEASNQIFTLTERLRSIGGFNKDVKRLQDWDTWLRLAHLHGQFIRFNHVSYIMHHDHGPHEIRVSQNEKITSALLSLAERNSDIYSSEDSLFMVYLVNSMNKKTSFFDSLYWSCKKKNPKYIVKYFLKR
ncbi:glycosyltransferase [Raoultella ornithinolytica]|uniref:glycosyltransferase n=1 Tax=Raoultella ornithinolytica TaxID=54291 RepID=UPI001E4F35C5|nr:glycosyltransferase [Raoultella ornithinolytica]MCC2037918.1 glycosyltransferase [Raoultella ornithinolytica]MCC2043501.1 glycosyltransferase [Raoultella ornithinolytica]MCC2048475.1 glycosyltransferase [Raoultella ornithinolytica]MCC2053979.1 glycosyltransferase [Raoultella ornithinolytica]MCC2058818.1 glycosyltransferase [Raoultella ornithinolytica]